MRLKRGRENSVLTVLVCALVSLILFSGFNIVKTTKPNGHSSRNITTKTNIDFAGYVGAIYDAARLKKAGLGKAVFEKAVTGYYNIKDLRVPVLTVIDFTRKSTEKRLWVIDMIHHKLLYNTLVAHGKNSGEQYAEHFSNNNESNMSSIGFFLTGDIYAGKHGQSLTLNGLEAGFNDHAKERSIVMHAADYVSEDFIKKVGRLGRSQGCPALPVDIAPGIIGFIANGSCLFIYYPDKQYEQSTKLLDTKSAAVSFRSGKSLF